MGRAIKDFFADVPQLPTSDFLDRTQALKQAIYSDVSQFRRRLPVLEAFMVTTGRWDEPTVVRNSMQALQKELFALRIFEHVAVEPIDAVALRERHRRALQPPEATITFGRRSTVPSGLAGVESAYVGLLQGREFLKLIRDDDGRLRASLFEDNVRDFQGSTTCPPEYRVDLPAQQRLCPSHARRVLTALQRPRSPPPAPTAATRGVWGIVLQRGW